MSADVSIVVVNFNTARFLGPLMESIAAQEVSVDGRPAEVEVIVVDNASKGEDCYEIERLRERHANLRLVQNTVNTGYAQANNQGYHVASGRYHMILNPDTRLLEGCLQRLVGYLEAHPEVDMVGPRAFMDLDRSAIMPPNELPTPELYELQTRAQENVEAALENLERRTRFSLPFWTATEPIEVEMLSGCCVMFRRELFEGGHPFDPGFPLYFEDTDLFMRMRRDGRRLVYVPDADMIHFFSRSAYTHAKGAEYRHGLSEERYFKKHFGQEGLDRCLAARKRALEIRASGLHVRPFDFEEIVADVQAPEFYVDADGLDWYAEIAGNPIFSLAAAIFPTEEGWFTISPSMWEELGPNTYWVRCVSTKTLETVNAWELVKEEEL